MSNIRPGITILIIYLIMAAIPAAICAVPDEAGYTKVITENCNGKTIQVKQGDIFYLRACLNIFFQLSLCFYSTQSSNH